MSKTKEQCQTEIQLNISLRSMKLMFGVLGVVSGFPLAISGSMIQMWLTEYKIDLATIGSLTLLALPYGIKFLWTPLLESYYKTHDPYRFWMSISCFLMSTCLLILTTLTPTTHTFEIIAVTMLFSFCSASFDAMLDGYRLSNVPENEMGITTSCYVLGYRIGLLITGGVGAIIADPNNFGFGTFYQLSFGFMLLSALFVTLMPNISKRTYEYCYQSKKSLISELKDSFQEMLKIPGILYLAGIIMTYRFCDTLLAALSINYFQSELNYSLSTLGFAYKISAPIAAIAGSFIGGLWLDKKGVYSLLNKICLIQGLANFSYLYLYYSNRTVGDLIAVVWIEHFCGGLANSAFVVLLSSIAMNIKHNKATAYALLSAMYVPTRVISGFIAAYCVSNYGWPTFIIMSSCVIVIPIGLVVVYQKTKSAKKSLGVHSKNLSQLGPSLD